MGWNYQREERQFEQCPVGKHRVRVKAADFAKSKSGKDMIALQFEVSRIGVTLYHYIVFLPDRPEITNANLTAFFDSFKDIKDGDFKITNWVGKVGAVMVAPDKDDTSKTRISYFIKADKQGDIPAWVEPKTSTSTTPTTTTTPVADEISESDLPF